MEGLRDDCMHTRAFDAASLLRDLRWPVDMLKQADPDTAVLQFCRELCKGEYSGDPVASLLLLGPGGAGKSTLLHRFEQGEFYAGIKSTDGLRIGTCGGVTQRGAMRVGRPSSGCSSHALFRVHFRRALCSYQRFKWRTHSIKQNTITCVQCCS